MMIHSVNDLTQEKNSVWSKSNKELATRLMKEGKITKAGYEAIDEGKRSGKWQDLLTPQK